MSETEAGAPLVVCLDLSRRELGLEVGFVRTVIYQDQKVGSWRVHFRMYERIAGKLSNELPSAGILLMMNRTRLVSDVSLRVAHDCVRHTVSGGFTKQKIIGAQSSLGCDSVELGD